MPTLLPPRAPPQTEPVGISLYAAVALAAVFLTCGMVLGAPTTFDTDRSSIVAAESAPG